MDWYPWFLKDYRRDTRHLGLAEDGAYRRLIDAYMDTREPLPDNDAALAAICSVGIDEWRAVAPAVRQFFKARDGFLCHKRCDREISAQNTRMKRNSENGKKAAFVRWSKTSAIHARAMHQPATLTKSTSLTSTESVSGVVVAVEKRPSAAASESLEENIRRKGWAP